MDKYQTSQDVANEAQVAALLKQNLTDGFEFVGHQIRWTPRDNTGGCYDHDYDIWWRDSKVGVVEIKCRQYPKSFFDQKGYLISRDKLAYLWSQDQKGYKAMLAVRTQDGFIYHAMIQDLVKYQHEWRLADPHMTATTNHGQGAKPPEICYILPMNLFSVLTLTR